MLVPLLFAANAALAAPAHGLAAHSPHVRIIYRFKGGADGAVPQGQLLPDGKGGFFGVTEFGGVGCASGCGTVFKLTQAGAGFVKTTIHEFNGSDGAGPESALIADDRGDLFGTASQGGMQGQGTAFKLIPNEGGSYGVVVMHSFAGGTSDGRVPTQSLLLGPNGTLFGTTSFGGSTRDAGTAFALIPSAKGTVYTESILHAFGVAAGDGYSPSSALMARSDGSLLGETCCGGSSGSFAGALYSLTPNGSSYRETVLASFTGVPGTGDAPVKGFAAVGSALFGVTQSGGESYGRGQSRGTVFAYRSSVASQGLYDVYNFGKHDGNVPSGALWAAPDGTLYGTTESGGDAATQYGTIFTLTPAGNGYVYHTIFAFDMSDGASPGAGLVAGNNGKLYGTTQFGGTNGDGVIFELTP